ncbi:hypothetical protein H4217_006647 [Coemansia sp. RSA 1939]|nr:hypothetical protein H4217_006647 [Coemansia sp. RSA 1939]KAJ2607241.1 hypothetical protein EV177_005623 [Coemansia sp. RSA 1804]
MAALLTWDAAPQTRFLSVSPLPQLPEHFLARGAVFIACFLAIGAVGFWYRVRNSGARAGTGTEPRCIAEQPLLQGAIGGNGNEETADEELETRCRPRSKNIGLGVRGMVAASRNPRRYHSIAILADSMPLLMETCDEFIVPRQPQRTLRKHSASQPRQPQQMNESNADGRRIDAFSLHRTDGGDKDHRRFATTSGAGVGKSGAERECRMGGGGRRVFTLPSLASSAATAAGFLGTSDSTNGISANAPASLSASTACSSR